MPTNANVFNSRVTSEALEAKFRQVFPAQGGAELVQDLFASGVIQPVVDFSTVAEGSVLPPNLQTAWDFSTGQTTVSGSTSTIITNTGFWQCDLTWFGSNNVGGDRIEVYINSGITTKIVYKAEFDVGSPQQATGDDKFVVFLRSGDSLVATSVGDTTMSIWYRQIADVNGTLVNPLGFTFS